MREDMNLRFPFASNEPPPAAPPPPPEHTADTAVPAEREPEPGAPAPPKDVALADWKAALRRDFERWLETVDAIPSDEPGPSGEAEKPDLYSIYEQLAALGAESRRANRKTAEVFSQWGETLAQFDIELARLREQLAETGAGRDEDRLSREQCLVLVELLDRLRRVQKAFEVPPPSPRSWWRADDSHWRKAWETQRQAFDIVVEQLESLLEREGVVRIETVEEPFDPQRMVAAAAEPDSERPHQTVIEEIAAGYLRDGELLRAAQVKVSLNKGSA